MAGMAWMTRRRGRIDRTRAALFIFGGWLLVTGLVLSFAQGIIHPYYTIALAPAIGALVGIGAVFMWQHRASVVARAFMAAAAAATAVWSFVLLDRSPGWLPPLRFAVLVVGILAAGIVAVTGDRLRGRLRGRTHIVLAGAAIAAAASGIAGPIAYTLDTVSTPHTGAIPSAGPALTGAAGAFGGGPGGAPGGAGGGASRGSPGATGNGSPGATGGGFPGAVSGGFPGASATGGSSRSAAPGSSGGPQGRGAAAGGAFPGARGGQGGRQASGGFLGSSTPGRALVELLERDAGHYKWVAATVGSNSAAGYQLATDDPVMAIGGFNGTDPAPTLAEFENYVHQGKIHWFIVTSGPGSGSSGTDAARITAWVEAHFKAQTVDGTTVYDLTA